MPEIEGIEHAISSNEVFHLEELPKRIVIVGGGYIANEFAGIFQEFGAHVTLVNRSDTLLRHYDQQIVDRLIQISVRKGIDFQFNALIDSIERRADGTLRIKMTGCDDFEADQLLFATGRRPNIERAGAEGGRRRSRRQVSDQGRRGQSYVGAVDLRCRGRHRPRAAHSGRHSRGPRLRRHFFGNKPHQLDYSCVPSAVFSHPPLAGVGLTEGEARNRLGTVKTYTSDFRAMKNVLAGRNERSLYKLVVDGETDEIVGIHMIGPDAPEILQAAAIAVKAKLKKADFDDTVALHPTMAEELVLMR